MVKGRKPRKKKKSKERGRISRIDPGMAWQSYDGGQVARDMSERRRKTVAAITPVQLSAVPLTAAAPTLAAVPRFSATHSGKTEPVPVPPAPQAIIPTMYPAEPGGAVVVQNQITINIQ